MTSSASLVPPRIEPPRAALGGLAFARAFLRNPLEAIPQAAYEEDFVPIGSGRAWVTSPTMIRSILVDQRDRFGKVTQIRLLGPLLGRGILTSEREQWKWQRQASAPMFTPEKLAAFVPVFVRAAEARIAKWRAADGPVQPMEDEMTRATFDVGFFDFPMIDNTRLANGIRCAVTLNAFAADVAADLTTVCFPGEYASLKDRPYYDEVIHKLQSSSERTPGPSPP